MKKILLGVGAAVIFLAALLASLAMGSVPLYPREIFAVLAERILGLHAGLADPYAMGVSSGASLGAVVSIVLGAKWGFSLLGSTEIFAFVGAILASLFVYAMAKINRRIAPTAALLLSGVAVGSFISAIVSLIVTLNDRDLHTVFFWMLGGFGGKGWGDVATILPVAIVAFSGALAIARPLDILGAGEEAAGTLGLDMKVLRRAAVGVAALAAAAAVSAGGVIGFVGLLGPHIARLAGGSLHRRLIPLSAAAGAILLMLADALARTVIAPVELPVGIVTALLGAPVFLRLLASPKEGRVL
ncbi:MAG: ABC-type Fe3+-siderophore transport system permease component [Spirochaetes bacterium]|nr:MAG: ABC-type Fe3+-siderophore transport system permease component [Spirochaetota bacterium]